MTVVLDRDWVTIGDPEQIVLEADPYRRLSYRWHAFAPEWAAAYAIDDELLARYASEPRSTATFELEEVGSTVKLTVVHDGFEPGSAVLEGIREGWPQLLASLKTLLGTGEPLAVAS